MPACFGRGEMTRSDADSMLLSLLICGLLKSFPCRCLRSKELICWRMRLMYFSTCSPGVAGMVNATITPAMVACTPLCMKRYHSSMPSQRYSQRRRMLQRLAMMSRSSTPPPASSHDRERWDEYGYYKYAANVVNNGKSSQKYFQAQGNSFSKEAQNTQRKSYVGGHGDSQPCCSGGMAGEQCKECHRNNHSADGSNDRQEGLSQVGQLANQYFTFDFQSCTKKEDCH